MSAERGQPIRFLALEIDRLSTELSTLLSVSDSVPSPVSPPPSTSTSSFAVGSPPSMIGFNANKNTLHWKDNHVQNSIIATCGNSSSQKIITSFQESRSIVEEAKQEYIPPLWLARYKQLKEFKDIYGHCHVPQRFNTNKSLGKWVHKHRQMARENVTSIKIDHYRALGKIGFWLDPPDRHSISWNRRYVELMKYRNHFGNCNVPQRYAPNPPLGIWVHRQRGELKKMLHGNQTRMTLNRAQALIEIAF